MVGGLVGWCNRGTAEAEQGGARTDWSSAPGCSKRATVCLVRAALSETGSVTAASSSSKPSRWKSMGAPVTADWDSAGAWLALCLPNAGRGGGPISTPSSISGGTRITLAIVDALWEMLEAGGVGGVLAREQEVAAPKTQLNRTRW